MEIIEGLLECMRCMARKAARTKEQHMQMSPLGSFDGAVPLE